MRKITAALMMSLDGAVESPEHWNMRYFNDEMGATLARQCGCVVLPRRWVVEPTFAWRSQARRLGKDDEE